MAKVLTTKASAAVLEDIIKRADKELYLISYHFIISEQFLTLLKHASDRGVKIKIVYGNYINNEANAKLIKMSNVQIFHYENLHAKIFANQDNCVVGSMNFSEASEIRNYELGVKFSKVNDVELYNEVLKSCLEVIEGAKSEQFLKPLFKKINEREKNFQNLKNKPKGFCVRCSSNINYNSQKPLCLPCYDEWSEWENVNYKEVFCHHCGKEKEGLSFGKPKCNKCYKESIALS